MPGPHLLQTLSRCWGRGAHSSSEPPGTGPRAGAQTQSPGRGHTEALLIAWSLGPTTCHRGTSACRAEQRSCLRPGATSHPSCVSAPGCWGADLSPVHCSPGYTPPPLTACLLSAQCQRLPPAQLLVPAGQPAAPGPALCSHQGDGDSPGPPQSLAGEWLWRMGTGWGAEGRGVPSAGHGPAGGPRARVGASSRWGREGSTGALRETPPASPPPEGCRFSRPRRDRGSGPPEVGLSLP